MTRRALGLVVVVGTLVCATHGTVGAQAIAWIVARQPTSPSYIPVARDQFNSAGQTNTVTRVGAGRYVLSFPGLSDNGASGVVHLSPLGGRQRCRVLDYTNADRVEVACGADHEFVAVFYGERAGASEHTGAYVVADRETAPAYAPDASRSYNSAGGSNVIRRTSPGEYEVVLGRVAPVASWPERELALVTDYGPGTGRCFAHRVIRKRSRNAIVSVSCNGTDSKFILSYLRDAKLGTATGTARTAAFMTSDDQYVTGFVAPRFQTRLTSPGSYAVLLDPLSAATSGRPGVALIRSGVFGDCWPVSWGGTPHVELNLACVDRDGQPTSFAEFEILYLGTWQGSAVVTKRDAACQVTDDYRGCQRLTQCSDNTYVASARVACNLEYGTISDAALAAVPDHRMRVVKASDVVEDGVCWARPLRYNSSVPAGARIETHSGEISIGSLVGRQTVEVGCKEHDRNHGDCHVRVELTCRY